MFNLAPLMLNNNGADFAAGNFIYFLRTLLFKTTYLLTSYSGFLVLTTRHNSTTSVCLEAGCCRQAVLAQLVSLHQSFIDSFHTSSN